MVIEDSGDGIPEYDLAHIFDRFSSGPSNTGRRGTGLGLALAQAVARGHGGEVRVHGDPGSGSRFELRLPLLAAAPAIVTAEADLQPAGSPFSLGRAW